MSNADPEAEKALRALFEYAAQLVGAGNSQGEVESKLRERGVDAEVAQLITHKLFALRGEARKKAGSKNMLIGALWCVGGLAVTGLTYSAASDGGGTYIVTWGAIIFGAIQFFRGLVQYSGSS